MIQINLNEWEDIGNLKEYQENPYVPIFEINDKSKNYVDIKDTSKKGIRIKSKNYVGFIPLDDNYLLVVNPKANVEDFLYMIFRSQGKKSKLKDFEKIVRSGRKRGIEYQNIFDFLLYVFLQELEKIRTIGFLKRSVPESENRRSIKGKILVKETILKNHIFGKKDKIWCYYYNLSNNILENAAIKFTLWIFLNINRIPSSAIDEFFEKYKYFDNVSLPKNIDFLDYIEDIVENNKIPTSRQYYVDILNLCIFFISNSKLDYKSGKEVKLRAFVINMNDVFENFIRWTLIDELNGNITIKRVQEKSTPLFNNKSPKDFSINPDFIFIKDDTFVCLADAKYKENPSTSDFYQLITYLDVYNLNKGILIYPLFDDCVIKELFVREDKEIWVYRIDLENIKESEENLVSFIEELINNA